MEQPYDWLRWASEEDTFESEDLQSIAEQVRRLSLQMIYRAGSGHPGGGLSAADVLTYLYFVELNISPKDPSWWGRDRFILSKGHSCPAFYALLGLRGCFGDDPVKFWRTFRKLNGELQGHPDVLTTPWAETSTGSLGQGFSVALGMALGLRFQNNAARVYVMLGDGESQEGEVWEAAMAAAHYKTNNLCVIVDYNKMQSDALNENIIGLHSLKDKWQSFNWQVVEINGHNFTEIKDAFDIARDNKNGPTCIISHTKKGRGVSYMEGSPSWHGSVQMTEEEISKSMIDLHCSTAEMDAYKKW